MRRSVVVVVVCEIPFREFSWCWRDDKEFDDERRRATAERATTRHSFMTE